MALEQEIANLTLATSSLQLQVSQLQGEVQMLNATIAQLMQVMTALASRSGAAVPAEATNVTPIGTGKRGPGRPKKEPDAPATTPATQLAEIAQNAQAEAPKAITYEQVKNALVALGKVKADAPFELLEKHKLTRLPDLKPEHFEAFMRDIEAAH